MTYQPDYGPESRFTASRYDCPRPEQWTSADGDSTELEVSELVGGFIRGLQPETVLETGTAWGQTTGIIADALRRNGHGHLRTIETDIDRVLYVREKYLRLNSWMTVVWGNSMKIPILDETVFDFCWFDSLIELRAAEFRRFYPNMNFRCVVGFHDTGPQHALKPDIDRLAAEGLIAPLHLPTPRGVTFARVLLR